jgi:hypothetical protein
MEPKWENLLKQANHRCGALEANWARAQGAAAKRFATLNNLRHSQVDFGFNRLRGLRPARSDHPADRIGGRLYDHPDFFRSLNGHCVAAVVHPYPAPAAELRANPPRGLVLHEPEGREGVSWYAPGHTVPICITRAGVTVVEWPEQELIDAVVQAECMLSQARDNMCKLQEYAKGEEAV